MYFENTLPNGHVLDYGFMECFDAFDESVKKGENDITVISKVFEDLFNQAPDDIHRLTDLACVVNLRCWYWFDVGDSTMSRMYSELYYKVNDHILGTGYENGTFTDEDVSYYARITD